MISNLLEVDKSFNWSANIDLDVNVITLDRNAKSD